MTDSRTARAPVVVHMSFSGDFGGREKVAASLQRAMVRSGHRSLLYMIVEERVGPVGNANLIRSLGPDDGNRRLFRTGVRFSLPLLWQLRTQLVADDVTVVHCHCYKSLFYSLLLRGLGLINARVVYTLHGLVLEPGWNSSLIEAVQRAGLRLSDGIVGCSEEILRANAVPTDDVRTTAIINAIEPPSRDFETLEAGRATARGELVTRFGLRGEKPVAINVGRLCPQKNYPLYFKMIREDLDANNGDTRAHYLVLGNGKMERELREEARLMGVERHVVFTGFVADMDSVFSGADLLIQTSTWEGTPMCLLEAQSYGLPSVVPDVGGNGAVIVNGENGYLYPVGDLAALTGHVDAYLRDSDQRVRHGRAASRNARTRFGTEPWVQQHMEFYTRIGSPVAERGLA